MRLYRILDAETVALGPGPTLLDRVDEQVLLLVIGVLLLLFGGRWLRKTMLRSAVLIAKHDEAAAFAAEISVLSGTRQTRHVVRANDWAKVLRKRPGVHVVSGVDEVLGVVAALRPDLDDVLSAVLAVDG